MARLWVGEGRLYREKLDFQLDDNLSFSKTRTIDELDDMDDKTSIFLRPGNKTRTKMIFNFFVHVENLDDKKLTFFRPYRPVRPYRPYRPVNSILSSWFY